MRTIESMLSDKSCPFVGSGYALNTALSFSHLFNLASKLAKLAKASMEIVLDDENGKIIRFYFSRKCYEVSRRFDDDFETEICRLSDVTNADNKVYLNYTQCQAIYKSLYHKY